MTKRRTESQIVAILKEADAGMPASELCRKHAIGMSTYWGCRIIQFCRG